MPGNRNVSEIHPSLMGKRLVGGQSHQFIDGKTGVLRPIDVNTGTSSNVINAATLNPPIYGRWAARQNCKKARAISSPSPGLQGNVDGRRILPINIP